MSETGDFAGRRVLITGAAGGIGLDLATRLAGLGAQIHACDVEETALAEARVRVPEIKWDCVDCANADQLTAWVENCVADGLDMLVNNVGISGSVAAIDELSPSDWDRVLRTNLDSAFIATRASASALRQSKGTILNISSAAAQAKPADRVAYVVSKAGLEAFTLVAAQELGPHGVRVNAIRPGLVDNPRWRNLVRQTAEQSGRNAEDLIDEVLGRVSLRRVVQQDEVVELCLFLLSDRASAISGQIVGVDGHVQIGP